MKKIIIIGCPGSGKSTFSKQLYNKIQLPLFHLDMLFWNKDKTHVSRQDFDLQLNDILKQASWIIDGNYSRTLEMRIKACDTVFLFDFSTDVCLSGVEARIGRPRSDMPWVEQEFDDEFRQWIIDFPNKELPYINSLLKKYNHKNIIVFHSHSDVDEYLNGL